MIPILHGKLIERHFEACGIRPRSHFVRHPPHRLDFRCDDKEVRHQDNQQNDNAKGSAKSPFSGPIGTVLWGRQFLRFHPLASNLAQTHLDWKWNPENPETRIALPRQLLSGAMAGP